MPDVPAAVQSKAMLPSVVLGSRPVPLNVLRFIPLQAAEKYQICAFEAGEDTVKLAVVHPEQLKHGFDTALRDIAQSVGKRVMLYKTDPASFRKVIRQYREQSGEGKPEPAKASPAHVPAKPPLFELGHTVVYAFLRRIPLEYATKRRLICVDYLKPNTYWFVTDGTNDKALESLLPAMEKENGIVANLIHVSPQEFEDLSAYYARLEKEEAKGKDAPQPAQEAASKDVPVTDGESTPADPSSSVKHVAPLVLEHKQAAPQAKAGDDAVVNADIRASILVSEEERGGIAGILQRVGQSLSAPKSPEPETAPAPPPLPPLPPIAAPSAPAAADGVKGPDEVSVPAPAVQSGSAAQEKTGKANSVTNGDKLEEEEIGKLLTKQVEKVEELKEIVRKGFVPRMVAAVVSFGIHEKASDIHIEAFDDQIRIRFRIDGQLIDIIKIDPEVHSAMVSRIKILARLRLDESRVPQDGRFDVKLGDAQIDLRISIMPTVHGEKVVMRILDKSKGAITLESLGIQGKGYERLLHAITRPYGICLMTGPTGSGKSTSLYAILQRVSMPNVNIVTLEDPVEYELKGVNQSQIRPKIGFTFAEGLRAVLRQDPNIIMVGEIRDGETATMATQAALTGHLVLSTLHTNDAAGAIPRLTNMGIEPFLIASSMNVAVGQRLVRKLCPDCKAEVDLPGSVKDTITADLEKIIEANPVDAKRVVRPFKFYQGTGCATCRGNGYLGRMGIYEVMESSEAIQDLTLKRASTADIQAQARSEGMITMYQDGLLKAIAGLTSLDEVLRESTNT